MPLLTTNRALIGPTTHTIWLEPKLACVLFGEFVLTPLTTSLFTHSQVPLPIDHNMDNS